MPRIPYPTEVSDEVERLLADRPDLNVYRALSLAPRVLGGWLALGQAVLREAKLDRKLRELVILRVGELSNAAYELAQHRRVAAQHGLEPEKIDAANISSEELDRCTIFDPGEKALLRFTDEVVDRVKASDRTFGELRDHLSDEEIVETLITISMYMGVARITETLEVTTEGEVYE